MALVQQVAFEEDPLLAEAVQRQWMDVKLAFHIHHAQTRR
jgi:hypothetical protein